MAFQLRIAEGQEAGREFTFEQHEVLIGRTSECDVVLYDPGISRKHCRFFTEKGAYFVEDMQSANGTRVNGAEVKRHELANGDEVSLGAVVFSFTAVLGNDDDELLADGAAQPALDASTRIVSSADMARPKSRNLALVPAGADATELEKIERKSTRMMKAVPTPVALADTNDIDTGAPRQALARASAPVRRVGPLSAAEKARLRRQSGEAMGKLLIFWAEASTTARALVAAGGGLFVLGALAVLVWVLSPPSAPKPPPEPTELSSTPIQESFGLGEGVTYEHEDQKTFDYAFNTPAKQAIVMVRFQSRDIGDKEVMLTVNGADIEALKADGTDQEEKQYEIKIPAQHLEKGKPNKIIFDNMKNPPGEDTWRIWNVWVEMTAIPEVPAEQLQKEATASFEKGRELFERREIGAENTYQAYRRFREAWLLLEATPDPKPELYGQARDRMREAQRELDKLCQRLLLGGRQQLALKRYVEARAAFEEVKRFFPRKDQACRGLADWELYSNDL
ncbi:MAG: FHA domain-containing protein [Myxococcaceae bacterium]|nr:FHA domain-containing protein [Myxococcaceae bacterium]